jgi:putative transposase
MATWAVKSKGRSIRRACELFGVSQTCYRYKPKLSGQNEQIADWLLRLTHNQRNWGFGLCYLFLRNVKGFGWNHKRVYRIYRLLGDCRDFCVKSHTLPERARTMYGQERHQGIFC